MKILITGLNFSPELTGIGKYTGEMAHWLAAAGAEVRVVTAPPYYPAWRVSAGFSGAHYRRERAGKVSVLRCPLYVPSQPTGRQRILHLVSFGLSSAPATLWHALTWRPDLVFVVEPPLACAPVAWLAARLSGAACWLHVQDFELDAAFELGMLKSGLSRRILNSVERWLLRRFDRVSTISGKMLERLAAKGVAPQRRHLFPNWTDFERVHPLPRGTALRAELGIADDTTVLLYSGTFGAKQGLELLVEAVRRIGDRARVELLLCGDGPVRTALEMAAGDLANVRFLPLQPLELLNDLMSTADIHLLPQRAGAADLVMPSKLPTMLASGRAVIASAAPESELGRLVARVGRIVPPGDAGALAEAIVELVADPALREQIGLAGRELARGLWEVNAVLAAAFGHESVAPLGLNSPLRRVAEAV
ncbi:MAG: glycosyltransferase WbuB [Pseudomonadota bacterium]